MTPTARKEDSSSVATSDRMKALGIPGALIECSLERASKSFLSAQMKGMISSFHNKSWGLVGTPGIGKSGLIAGIIRNMIERDIGQGRNVLPPVIWVDWPMRSDTIRRRLSAKDFASDIVNLDDIHELVDETENPILVLDDLGRERVGTTKNWATEKLELLLEKVYNDRSITLHWTSNFSVSLLNEVYGPALVSRLAGKAPDIVCPSSMPDRRLNPSLR